MGYRKLLLEGFDMSKARLVFAVLLLLMVSAVGSVVAQDEPVTITLMGHSSTTAEDEALNEAVAAFEEANPNIDVDVQLVPEYDTVIATAFASGDYPEVFYVNQDRV